jgi:ATP-dependent RNA helicase DeaD
MGPREHHLLKNIERLTRQRVEVNKLPTVADLRARRLELTRAAIEQALQDEEALDHFRVVVEALADEFDVVDIAAAAVRLADEATRGELTQEEDIPEPVATRERKDGKRERKGGKGERKEGKRERGGKERGRKGGASEGMTRIFIGAGRKSGIRPQDLVGAIANEAGISSREIGAIEIADRFSLVEIAEHSADDVIGALRASALKGKRVTVRRER